MNLNLYQGTLWQGLDGYGRTGRIKLCSLATKGAQEWDSILAERIQRFADYISAALMESVLLHQKY